MVDLVRPQDPNIGKTIGGHFKVERILGTGGMGTVYLAKQVLSERPTALKLIHPHLVDQQMLTRFTQEAVAISRLMHPNIVTVFTYGQHEQGALYIAMEHIEGVTLTEMIKGGRLALNRALPLMIQLAEAFAYAHENKIIHRDIKPENIMVSRMGRKEVAKVLDFGIAKILDDEMVRTQTGQIFGSPPYMSPEQWSQDRSIDGRTDIYSLGCVYYRMVSGRLPFEGTNTVAYMRAHLMEQPVHPAHLLPEIAEYPGMGEIIMKCIAREREHRFQDAYELVEALNDLQFRVNAVKPSYPSLPAMPTVGANDATAALRPISREVNSGPQPSMSGHFPSGPQPAAYATGNQFPSGPQPAAYATGNQFPPAVEHPSGQQPFSTGDYAATAGSRGRTLKIVATLAVLLALVIGGIVVAKMTGKKNKKATPRSDTSEVTQTNITQPRPQPPRPAPRPIVKTHPQPRPIVKKSTPLVVAKLTPQPQPVIKRPVVTPLVKKTVPPVIGTPTINVMIVSKPPGALVHVGSQKRGVTPILLAVNKRDALSIRIAKRGYLDATSVLSYAMAMQARDNGNKIHFRLKRKVGKKPKPTKKPIKKPGDIPSDW